ncbi:MAG TPA: N-acyl homoserine lactonase family protein [Candidatus Polarisedimenticolia bacterium]|nr:N-acyl homoserine lactonase family protein [Candidatus Polarisedimenticolia bacterium]
MRRLGFIAALLGMLCVIPSAGFAQVRGVYWTTSGKFGPFKMSGLIPTIPKDKDRDITIPVSMWVIDHPKGLVVYDTGTNVAIADGKCKSYWAEGMCDFLKPSLRREDAIDMQLKKLGYSPDQIKVVVTSHSHLDHIGNIKMFPKAIHVIQKKELYQAWWPEKFQKGPAFVMGDFDGAARDFNYLELEGDYDLFGDGSVTVLSTPGHTLGHQSLRVRLASGKTLVLTQDAVWMKENLEGYPAGLNYSVKDYNNSIAKLKAIRDIEDGDLFMAHDQDQYAEKGGRWYK